MSTPPQDDATETIDVHGMRIALRRYGPAGAAPVLCLHGWLDNANSFAPLSPLLPEVELIALDLPGHGRSAHRPDVSAYHQLDWVVDVVEAADRLGLDRFALMGHSMGAGIAAMTAGTIPERITALALLEGAGPRPTADDEVRRFLASYLEVRQSARANKQRNRGASFATAVRARLAFGEPLSRASAELLCEGAVMPADRGVRFTNDRRLQRVQPMSLSQPQILAFLSAISCPTLLLTAEQGLAFNPEVMAERAAAVADLRRAHVPGGHHVHMDDPSVVAPPVRELLGLPTR